MGLKDEDLQSHLPPVELTDAEVAALDRLSGMTDAEVDQFLAEFDAAWEANRDAVQTAKAELTDARRRQADVEVACGTAARARNPEHPVLSADELDLVLRARDAVGAAWDQVKVTQERFKAGVTDDQIAG